MKYKRDMRRKDFVYRTENQRFAYNRRTKKDSSSNLGVLVVFLIAATIFAAIIYQGVNGGTEYGRNVLEQTQTK